MEQSQQPVHHLLCQSDVHKCVQEYIENSGQLYPAHAVEPIIEIAQPLADGVLDAACERRLQIDGWERWLGPPVLIVVLLLNFKLLKKFVNGETRFWNELPTL